MLESLAQECEPDHRPSLNPQPQIRGHFTLSRVTGTGPLLVVIGRSARLLIAQALFEGIFFFRGRPEPWLAAAPWWRIYGTLVDVGCLALLWKFTRSKGLALCDFGRPNPIAERARLSADAPSCASNSRALVHGDCGGSDDHWNCEKLSDTLPAPPSISAHSTNVESDRHNQLGSRPPHPSST